MLWRQILWKTSCDARNHSHSAAIWVRPRRYSKESGHSGLQAFFCVQQSTGWQPGNNRLMNWDWWLVAVFHCVSAFYLYFFLALFSMYVFNSVFILLLMWKSICHGTCHILYIYLYVCICSVCVWIVWFARQELHLAVYMFNVCHNKARFQIIKLITTRACSVTTIMLSCSYEVFKAFLLCSWDLSAWLWSDTSWAGGGWAVGARSGPSASLLVVLDPKQHWWHFRAQLASST